MKNKSLFTQMLLLIVLGVVCLLSTIGIALLAGAVNTSLFDFANINFANLIPVLLIGIFVSCVIVGIAILCVGKTAFLQIYDYYQKNNNNNNNGGNKQ